MGVVGGLAVYLARLRELGGLFVVVGPGGRISTFDCSRVLNVNGSEPTPTCITIEGPVYV